MRSSERTERAGRLTARHIGAAFAFMKVVDCESFQEAARRLGLSRSAISKQIALLEKTLGVTLLNRTPRSISLTDAGRAFYGSCIQINEAVARATEQIRGRDERPVGLLRVSVPSSLGMTLMPMLVNDLLQRWRDLRVNLHVGDEFVDVVGGGYDVVLRVGRRLVDSSLYARRIATTPRVLVASPGYLARHGRLEQPADLRKHRCLARGKAAEQLVTWSFDDGGKSVDVAVSCALTASSDAALILAARLDMGILYVPELLVARELASGKLEKVLPSFCKGQEFGVFVIHPYKRCPAKVDVLIDFLETYLSSTARRQ